MPTQRPFLSNFLAAFRVYSPKPTTQASITTPSTLTTSSQSLWTSTTASSSSTPKPQQQQDFTPKPLNSKTSTTPTTTQDKLHPSLQHNVSPQTHLPRSPPSPGLPVYGPQNKPTPSYPTAAESRRAGRRRGSDSSSDSGGFREGKGGGEKWFIGGRAPNGEEKYYKLSMIKRDRSSDRISADQLSL